MVTIFVYESGMGGIETLSEEERAAIKADARDGMSVRRAAVKYHTSRSAMGRYYRDFLRIRRGSISEESRLLIRAKNNRLEGNLDAALLDAHKLKTLAEQKQDTATWLSASKLISRLLEMKSKRIGKLPSAVDVKDARVQSAMPRFVWEWDENEDPGFMEAFGKHVHQDAPMDGPKVYLKIEWQKCEVQNPAALLPIVTATPIEAETEQSE